MQITVVGTGNVGGALGRRWAEGDHEVVFATRDPGSDHVSQLIEGTNARASTYENAADGADVVVLATPWGATKSVLQQLGDLSGKVLVDCTNPLNPDLTMDESAKPSGGALVASWAPGARVVKAFSTTGSGNMTNPTYGSQQVAMLICGDDADAKDVVAGLATELGFDPVDNGPLSQSCHFEALAMIWIVQAYVQGWGPDFGFVVVKR